jgi:hypothetical protein
VIHIVTSHNQPHDVNIDLNETWVLEGGPETASVAPESVKSYRENYPGGKQRATWSAGVSSAGLYLLHGLETHYFEDGRKQWECTYAAGQKVGTETLWAANGRKKWERTHGADGQWTWRVYDESGRETAVSRWKGMDLMDMSLSPAR